MLLGLACTAHRNSVIFRREFPQLRAVIERSRQIYNAKGESHQKDSYNESLHVWRLLSGRMVEFGSCQHAKDMVNQQGRPRDLYGFDEATHFTEAMYRYISAWNRTTVQGQRCRIVCTGNPPSNVEGEWVIRYWAPWLDATYANPARPGELRWFARVDDKDVEMDSKKPFQHKGETITPRSRTFIPARLDDNPILMATGYMATLQAQPEPYRSQLLYGDFTVGLQDHAWQVIPTAWVRAAQKRWHPFTGSRPPFLSAVGVDPARGGADKTVISKRHGNWFAPLLKYPGTATPNGPAVAVLVLQAVQHHQVPVNVDVIGIGSSVYDSLCGKCRAVPINFAHGTDRRDRAKVLSFANVRAWAYWSLREALDPDKGDGLMLPPDQELLGDLTAARYEPRSGGIIIEPKEDIIERLGRSPDAGDAVVLAHLQTVTATAKPGVAVKGVGMG